ncbi:MAG: divalent-cation tolerance protein CutA [Thaumarchaeota archaeon]|nr:MAG: divalent-cation tolerance protein CutA [Nitrososphaerota archaeon]
MLGAYAVVFITAPGREEAEKIARRLLDERLVACANILDGVKSFFRWEGRVEEAAESLLLVKTRLDLLEKLIEAVRQAHSYTVPEIIALPIIAGNTSYLEWIDQSVEKPR